MIFWFPERMVVANVVKLVVSDKDVGAADVLEAEADDAVEPDVEASVVEDD